MDPFRPFYDMVAPFIPLQYSILAQQWGLYSYWGTIAAFIAAVLLLFGLFYLGSLIAFGRLIGESESAKKALILISAMMGIIGAWYAAGIMVVILSNIVFVAGIVMGVILLASIGRALLGGWYAAGATVEEARAEYFESLQEREKARLIYTKTRQQLLNQLEYIVRQLYQRYGDKLDTKIVIGYLKAVGLYDDYIKIYGSERKLKKAIEKIIHNLINLMKKAYEYMRKRRGDQAKGSRHKNETIKIKSKEDLINLVAMKLMYEGEEAARRFLSEELNIKNVHKINKIIKEAYKRAEDLSKYFGDFGR